MNSIVSLFPWLHSMRTVRMLTGEKSEELPGRRENDLHLQPQTRGKRNRKSAHLKDENSEVNLFLPLSLHKSNNCMGLANLLPS